MIEATFLHGPRSGASGAYLHREMIPIGGGRVRNLMRRMALMATYQKPRATVVGDPSERYPCLVDLAPITAVDRVFAANISHIPKQKGFL